MLLRDPLLQASCSTLLLIFGCIKTWLGYATETPINMIVKVAILKGFVKKFFLFQILNFLQFFAYFEAVYMHYYIIWSNS